ncbi:MAG: hypothetical protein AB1585_03130 [Thermodesulfobacteriota bacterium]
MTWESAFMLFVTAVVTLLGKWVWDRWLSQSSRVTAEACNQKREACVGRIMAALEKHTDRLTGGDECFDNLEREFAHIRKVLSVLMYTNLTFCKELKVDCDELSRILTKYGVME